MSAEWAAVLVTVVLFGLTQLGATVGLAYKVGQRAQQIDDHDRRIKEQEQMTRQIAADVARLQGKEDEK